MFVHIALYAAWNDEEEEEERKVAVESEWAASEQELAPGCVEGCSGVVFVLLRTLFGRPLHCQVLQASFLRVAFHAEV